MAAGAPMQNSMPEKFGKTEDVNLSPESSSLEMEAETPPSEESEIELEVEDVEKLEHSKHVPYKRFSQVNEKKNQLETQLASMESTYKSQMANLAATYEAKLQASTPTPKEEEDYEFVYDQDEEQVSSKANAALMKHVRNLENKLGMLEETSTQSRIEGELTRLEGQYPEADIDAVLGWKKVYPGQNLKDLMERSHNSNIDRTKKSITRMLEAKKAKAKNVVPLGATGGIKLKSSERPKTLKEATRMTRQFFGGL